MVRATRPGHTAGARENAARILVRLHQQCAGRPQPTVQELLHTALLCFSDPREAALCTELVYGALRQEPKLDWLLRLHLKQPDKLPLAVRVILLAAVYELAYLDRIPAHASINEAVSAVRRIAPGLTRLTNAVLRSIDRLGASIHDPAWYAERIQNPVERMAVEYAVPRWVITLWLEAYGQETAVELAQASSLTPWPTVRLNFLRPDWQDLHRKLQAQGAVSLGYAGLAFPPGTVPGDVAGSITTGRASWQGAGTQTILRALDAAAWQGPVWDACAGRGGKSCALLEMGVPVRLASDPHSRIRDLPRETARLGLPTPEWREAPAQETVLSFTPQTILVDAPCSGLGTLARRPDTRLNRGPEHLAELVALQESILSATWRSLPSGGLLAYITCTVNPDENERQIRRFLARHPEACCQQEIRTQGLMGADIMYGALIRKS